MSAIQVNESVWIVGTPDAGEAHTSSFDCIQYLVWDGTGGILVDVGSGLGWTRCLENIASVALPISLTGALISHYHGDHAGGASLAAVEGFALWGSQETADSLASGDETVTQIARAREAGIYPPEFYLQPTPGVQVLTGGDTLQAGGIVVTAIDAPGHCDGHLVYLVEVGGRRMLFSGDVIFSGGKISMQAIPDCRLDKYAETVIKLAGLGVDELYPGHGDVVLSGAKPQIAAAAATFARLVPPPNLLV
jgi:glyoxylase-like metal-dependent hydrolase (beta-lactamase superfamily II)